ncbi:hypothetical protein DW656_09595 [Coprococcus comes]|uniref:Uncharacterized protein n=1 Tax=Coprococcus comes TaxID=410072 RepID=A0A3R6GFK7_9FIRM|nr:hypothetical protein DW656_09595 [Coprococcus comes]
MKKKSRYDLENIFQNALTFFLRYTTINKRAKTMHCFSAHFKQNLFKIVTNYYFIGGERDANI